MSEFRCPIVRIAGFGKHPNADTLSITQMEGQNVIFRTGDFQVGDLAVYLPADAVVPTTVPGTEFLDKSKRRIRPMRLRGIYSEGVLLPIDVVDDLFAPGPFPQEGTDVGPALGVTKHEDPLPPNMAGEMEKDPGMVPVYDIESYYKYKHVIQPDEEVVITEKLHGTNFRAVYLQDRGLMVGSHTRWWKYDPEHPNLYWVAALKAGLDKILPLFPGLAVFGEVCGQVQDLTYGAAKGEVWLALFDTYDTYLRVWTHWAWLIDFVTKQGLRVVPTIYVGPMPTHEELVAMAEGQSLIADHIREGVVVKPVRTRRDDHLGRVILKVVGAGYKLRKSGTELH